MSSNLANVFIATNAKNFPAGSIPTLSNSLRGLDDSKMVLVLSTTLKKPKGSLFNFFLGWNCGWRPFLFGTNWTWIC